MSNIKILCLYKSVLSGLVIFINLKADKKTDRNWLFLLGPEHTEKGGNCDRWGWQRGGGS